jgi:hypothetical protein
VLAPQVTGNSTWVDEGTKVTRAKHEMKLSFAAARLGLAGARVCGTWTGPHADRYLRTVVAGSSVEKRKPLLRQGSARVGVD